MNKRFEDLIAKWRKQAVNDEKKFAKMTLAIQRGETVTMESSSGYVDIRSSCADELAAALVAEGQAPLDDANVWSQVRRLNEIRLRALVTPGNAIFNADDARFLLSLIEVRDRAFKELTRLTADRAAAPSLHKEGPLSEEDLAALDSLRETHPNLWRHIRECGQAVLLLHKEGAGGEPAEREALTKEIELLLKMAKDCDARGEVQSPQKEWTFYQGKICAYEHILKLLAASPAGRAEQATKETK